jgi:hypothetical protein
MSVKIMETVTLKQKAMILAKSQKLRKEKIHFLNGCETIFTFL